MTHGGASAIPVTGISTNTMSVADTTNYNTSWTYNFSITFSTSSNSEVVIGTINVVPVSSSSTTFNIYVNASGNSDYT